MATAQEIAAKLGLVRLPAEGGYFVETYRAPGRIPHEALPACYGGARPFATAIYYLVTSDTFSAMHRLCTDEVYHFYLGHPVEMLQIRPDGAFSVRMLGADLLGGQEPQVLVPAGVWQGSRLVPGGEFALLGTTVAPGYEAADYEHGFRGDLLRLCPQAEDLITALTHA